MAPWVNLWMHKPLIDAITRKQFCNVMRFFPASSRHNFSIVTLIEKPLGVHHIRTKLYFLPLQRLKSLFDESKSTLLPDSNSPKYSHWHHS